VISMALIKSASLTALIGASLGYWRHPESRRISLFRHSPAESTPHGTEEQAKWRAEFEVVGEIQLRDGVTRGVMPFPEAKRQFAFRWLRQQETAKALREKQLYRYAQWTFWAAGGAVFVGIIGVLVTVLH
jgi:hypothetical protein